MKRFMLSALCIGIAIALKAQVVVEPIPDGQGGYWGSRLTTNYSYRVWNGTSGGVALLAGQTYYFSPMNTYSNLLTSDTIGSSQIPVTRATTFQNLYVILSVAPGSSKTNTLTLMTTNASNTASTVTVAAGSTISVRVVTGASSVTSKLTWAFEGR